MGEHIHSQVIEAESSPREYLKFTLVILAIFASSILLTIYSRRATFLDWLDWFMGIFFLVFASFKLIGYEMFTSMFRGYDVIAKRFKFYSNLYPFIELFLAFLYLLDVMVGQRNYITLIIMATGTVGVWQEVRKRSGIHCACLGNVIKLPLSTVSLYEDIGMALMAVLSILLHR